MDDDCDPYLMPNGEGMAGHFPRGRPSLVTFTRLRVLSDAFQGMGKRCLPRDGEAEFLRGDPTVGSRPKVWTRDQKWKK